MLFQKFPELEQIKKSIEHTNFVLINSPADILVHPRSSQISTWKNLDVLFPVIDHSGFCIDLS